MLIGYFVGLFILGVTAGTQYGAHVGFYIIGAGTLVLSVMGLFLNYLDSGPKFQDVDKRAKVQTKTKGVE
jgi:hypothetical protein